MQVLLNSKGVEQSMSSLRFEDRIPNIMRKPKPGGTATLPSRCSRLGRCCALHIRGSEQQPTEAGAYCSMFRSGGLKKFWVKWSVSKENLEINNAGIILPFYQNLGLACVSLNPTVRILREEAVLSWRLRSGQSRFLR